MNQAYSDSDLMEKCPAIKSIKAIPWYLKDKCGYPIEFQEGKGRVIRIICQNIRKITG